jgi:rod shape determining protein RodA
VNLPSPTDYISVFKTTTRGRWDLLTPIALFGLGLFGILFIYSAQLPVHGSSWEMQLIWLTMGALIYLGVSLVDYRIWLSITHWFYLGCLLPLVVVLFLPNSNNEKWGSQRWIDFGFFSFQPSESAKIAVLLVTASILIRNEIGTVRQSFGVLGKLALAVGAPMFLILLQPDLKSAIVLPPMVFSMLYVSKLSSRFFAAALGAFLFIVSVVAWDTYRYEDFMESHNYSYMNDRGKYEPHSWVPLKDYQRNRIISFVSPDKIDPMGIGWNQRQSLISVGSGGF